LIRRFKLELSFVVRIPQFDRNVLRHTHNNRATVGITLALAPECLQEQKEFFGKHVRNLTGKRILQLVVVDRSKVQSLF
jgi:hypothetical protein